MPAKVAQRYLAWLPCLALCLLPVGDRLSAATFGQVVAIGGQAADLAIDEARGVLYVANFTANRIDVVSLGSRSVQTSINVAPYPSSLALSPDGRYLVVCHYGNLLAPATSQNSLSILNLATNARQTFSMGQAPLGVAFGIDNRALIVTNSEFVLLDPVTGVTQTLETIQGVTTKTLPTPVGNFPANIVASSMATSGDGTKIIGIVAGGASDGQTIEFSYDVNTRSLRALAWVSAPPLGPRVVSVNRTGNRYVAGWAMHDETGSLIAQFPDPAGILNVGSHAMDTARGVIYAQVTSTTQTSGGSGTQTASPILQIVDIDNLAVLDRLQLAENLAGRSLISSDGNTMYSVSESGVTMFPIGSLHQSPRLSFAVEDLVFQTSFCERQSLTRQVVVSDIGGARVPFTVASAMAGVTVSPSSGMTPMTLTLRLDPAAFQNLKGTATGSLTLTSRDAVNVPAPLRILVNNKEPDQRGLLINVPGKLVDILADPVRDRYFVLRQDKNQVLVFDGLSNSHVATLKTANTPTQLAITFDRRRLLVGHTNSQIISVFDLETLQAETPIRMPGGHYPRSVAASGRAILAANRVAGPSHTIDRVDLITRSATELPSLGVFENKIDPNTVLVASANGSSILAAQADGTLLLYNANVDTFTVGRKETSPLTGAVAASSFDQYVVGNRLLNSSLVPIRQFDASNGTTSGFAFIDQIGIRTTAPSLSSPGVIQRVNLGSNSAEVRPVRLVEAPLLGETGAVFTRTLAPLYGRQAIANLTVAGVTVLPWAFDAAVSVPRIDRLVNAADFTGLAAPGSLVSIFGSNLSPVNQVSSVLPLPTALGESCLTVNGQPVPMIFVSPSQINAQLPYQIEGNVTLILRTPGGVSDNFNLTMLPNAPSIFRSAVAGLDTGVPTIVRARNQELVTLSNPIHRDDTITIYLTGLGNTLPAIEAGTAASASPTPVAVVAPTVQIGNQDLNIDFAGLAPGQVGVYQINAYVPRSVPTGMDLPLTVRQGGQATQVSVRVIN
jgi:uncharacterized protein (TIGR03437 family)